MRGYPRRINLGLSLSLIFISGCTPEPETVPMVPRAVPAVQVADIGHLAGKNSKPKLILILFQYLQTQKST